jgi:hypothetical protein
MRTCSQKNTGEHLGPTEVSLHTRAVCLRHLRLGSFLTGSGCVDVISGLPPIATVLRTSLEVRFVPILLQKSFCGIERARMFEERAERRLIQFLASITEKWRPTIDR